MPSFPHRISVLKAVETGARTSMSEKHRSLASYFDEPLASNWHDQTELSVAGGHHDIPDFGLSDDEDFDGLHTEQTLGAWMWHPEHKKQVWVPDGVWSVYDIPSGMVYQEKGNTEWARNAWGAGDYEARHNMANRGKGSRPKETKEERAARREQLKKIMKDARAAALDIALHAPHFLPEELKDILHVVNSDKETLTKKKNDALVLAKSSGKKGAAKNQELHSMTSGLLISGSNWQSMLNTIDSFCKKYGLENILGTELPPRQDKDKVYLFVALSFLSQIKKTIMRSLLAVARKAIADGNKDRYLFDYVNFSYLANDQRKRLSKDRYPKNPKKGLPDSTDLATLAKRYRDLERQAFQKLHPNAKIPKRLKDNNGKRKGKKGKKGKGGGGSGGVVVEVNGSTIHVKTGGSGGNTHKKKHNNGPRPARHTFNHGNRPAEHEPERYEPDSGTYNPTYYDGRWREVQPDPRIVEVQGRLQRGYY